MVGTTYPNLGVGYETPDYPPHSALLNVNDGYQDTGKYAAQGPNIMSPEAPMMLPEARGP